MSIFEAIIMGIVQGLTEFLPVSSSGHLEILNVIFGVKGEGNLLFATVVHGGTVLSTIVVFRKEIGRLLKAFFRFRPSPEMRFVVNILVSMLPVLFVGLFLKDGVEALFTGNLLVVGTMLLVTAALLLFSGSVRPRPRLRNREMDMIDAFIIGIGQSFAVLPGLSRSGTTISTGLMLGIRREEVASFSFLMVLIPIIGANLLEVVGGDFSQVPGLGADVLIAGFLSSFIAGVFACRVMINLVKRGKLIWFALYCALLGIGVIVYTLA